MNRHLKDAKPGDLVEVGSPAGEVWQHGRRRTYWPADSGDTLFKEGDSYVVLEEWTSESIFDTVDEANRDYNLKILINEEVRYFFSMSGRSIIEAGKSHIIVETAESV